MIIFYYWSARKEEPTSIRKFGEDYKRYMERVPRLNIIWGIIKLLGQRKPNRSS
jgi:protein-S-isoprenylcysteine O-methyltransferase Ste14